MKVFYNISIFFLGLGLRLLSLFNPKAREFVSGRKDIFKKIDHALKNNSQPLIWIHCASLGEFEQGRPVIEAIKKEFGNHRIFLTFFSPSGYTVRKNYPGADYIFYLPLDTRKNARKFVSIVKPRLALFIKYEFWFHFSRTLKRKKNTAHLRLINLQERPVLFPKDRKLQQEDPEECDAFLCTESAVSGITELHQLLQCHRFRRYAI